MVCSLASYHVLTISLDPQNSPVITPNSRVKQQKLRDNCCNLLRALWGAPNHDARTHYPICFLHEQRYSVWFAHHLPLLPTQHQHVIGVQRTDSRAEGLSPTASREHTSRGSSTVVAPWCQPSAGDDRVPLGPGTNACWAEKAALSRDLESAREMGSRCILTASSVTFTEAFVKLPFK